MSVFDILTMIGGLALFLYGMEVMGNGLSKASGGRMERILEKMTDNIFQGCTVRRRCNSSYSVILSHNGHGCWLC